MARRASPGLEVRRMFEPNRFADEVVAEAYRRIVPVIQRALQSPAPRPQPRLRQDRRSLQRGGTHA